MLETACFCGEQVTGDDIDSQVADGVEHFASVHANLGLTETSIRNYLESGHRINGPVDRIETIGEIAIRPISSQTRDDIIEFFDYRAFADNPGWGMCYCMYHHVSGDYSGEWSDRPWQKNRDEMSGRIDAGLTTGVLAYVDGVLAGFCNATARSQFPAKASGSDDGVASIVCFVVAPPYRGHGVQAALLEGAIAMLEGRGFDIAEAYPIREVDNSAAAFVGKLSLYERAGFDVVSQDPLIVRKALG